MRNLFAHLPTALAGAVLCTLIALIAVAGWAMLTASPAATPVRLPTPSPGTPTAP